MKISFNCLLKTGIKFNVVEHGCVLSRSVVLGKSGLITNPKGDWSKMNNTTLKDLWLAILSYELPSYLKGYTHLGYPEQELDKLKDKIVLRLR